jgi:hypothetical protein
MKLHIMHLSHPHVISTLLGLMWFGLFVNSFCHTCNIAHVNYRLQFIYYNTTYNVWTSTQLGLNVFLGTLFLNMISLLSLLNVRNHLTLLCVTVWICLTHGHEIPRSASVFIQGFYSLSYLLLHVLASSKPSSGSLHVRNWVTCTFWVTVDKILHDGMMMHDEWRWVAHPICKMWIIH